MGATTCNSVTCPPDVLAKSIEFHCAKRTVDFLFCEIFFQMISILKSIYSPFRGTGLAYVLYDERFVDAKIPDDVFLEAHMSFVLQDYPPRDH